MNKIRYIKNIFFHYYGIIKHKFLVFYYIFKFCIKLMYRAIKHDISKFKFDEACYFIKVIDKLKNTDYGSVEYKKNLELIQPAIRRHYKRNTHHPEYYDNINGISKMNILDLIEMCSDWKASTKQHKNGNIQESYNISCERFGLNNTLQGLFSKKLIRKIIDQL